MKPICCFSSSSRIFDFLFFSLVIILITNIVTVSAFYNGNVSDHLALMSFKSMITEDPYGVLSTWNTSFHFCDWVGVSCGKQHRRVTSIQLKSLELKGSLSPHVGNLSFLHVFSLKNNSFQGTIPHELGRLSRLRFISLGYNKFNGFIPKNLSGCTNLEHLRFENNNLVGSIPMEISFLSKLATLLVDFNNLNGGIPPFLGNISSMKKFSAPKNPFGGTIPDTLGRLKNIRELHIGGCKLHGTIPYSIYNLSLLTSFSLAENRLIGGLPSTIGAMLPNLVFFQLWGNQLSGVLPPSISNCSKLSIFEPGENKFIGKLTVDFSKLKDISDLYLGSNLFGSKEGDEMKFIDSLNNCSKLERLILYACGFQGVMPSSIGNLSDHLQVLDLHGNRLHGNLPSSIGKLVGLSFLNVAYNRFTGRIPSTIGMLQNLQVANFHDNQFTGSIPDAIGNLSLLNILFLYTNRLESNIPSSLTNCRQLLQLVLDDNKLLGEIPKQLLTLPSLTTLSLAYNSLSDSLPAEVGNLKMLNYLYLSYNNLSGNIPGSLGGCTSLIGLFLNGNLFQGMIPPSLSSLRGMMQLDLSQNNLSGQIPRFLEHFSLQFLNLSFNDFEGEVPILGLFANASAFSLSGNSRLCGGLLEVHLPKCNKIVKHNKKFPLFAIVILSALALFSILCFVYAWSTKKRKSQPSQSTMNERFLQVSYNQLLKATDGFSEAKLIGEGGVSSVYKGMLDVVGDTFVAIKVLHLQFRGAHRSFLAECEAWRSIRHRNLLKIITSCSSVDFQGNDFKALVYEFMPKGSLHDWLHSSANTSKLNLLQRLNILKDVASALDYLHNHCERAIFHGDLKPSNILLDDDMVAHVGDFGLARFVGTNSNINSSTGIRGTTGYVPPEYGIESGITSNGDVYSFGILLLEVMTGKRPTDDIFNNGLNLHNYAYMALPDHVISVIDGELLNVQQEDAVGIRSQVADAKNIEECMASTVKIGVLCSMDSPPRRMNIENVVHELQHILDRYATNN